MYDLIRTSKFLIYPDHVSHKSNRVSTKNCKKITQGFFFKDLGNDLVFCLNLDKKYENHILHE